MKGTLSSRKFATDYVVQEFMINRGLERKNEREKSRWMSINGDENMEPAFEKHEESNRSQ